MPRLDGIDIYHGQWEKGVNLQQVHDIPTFWFAQKATQSTKYTDPFFEQARREATLISFRMRGYYHWLSSTTDVDAQAAHYLAVMGIWQIGEFAMLDAEEKGITVAMCLRWCELVEAVTHRPCVIYTGLYVAGGTIWKSDALRMSKYGPRPFIVAAYVTEANLTARMGQTGALPKYPRDAWQFSSNGPVPGVTGRCDMDQVDNVAAFELACEISHIPIPVEDNDMQVQLLVIQGYAARLLANCPDAGDPLRCEWSGPADDSQVTNARIEWFRAAFHPTALQPNFEMGPFTADLLAHIALDGQVPPGMEASLFANADEIKARTAVGGPLHIEATLVGTATPGGG